MNNPFALNPGEILSRQKLFDRYVDWRIFNRKNKTLNQGKECSDPLYSIFLCCQDHADYYNQYGQFMRYFWILKMTDNLQPGLSDIKLRTLIKKNHLRFDLKKIALIMRKPVGDCLRFLSEEKE